MPINQKGERISVVTPRAGVWIEIEGGTESAQGCAVTPRAGERIEITSY